MDHRESRLITLSPNHIYYLAWTFREFLSLHAIIRTQYGTTREEFINGIYAQDYEGGSHRFEGGIELGYWFGLKAFDYTVDGEIALFETAMVQGEGEDLVVDD